VNTAYKHLDSKLRVAELSVGQWIAVLAGLVLGIVWGVYISPFGTTITTISAVYLGAVPGGAALFASLTEFDPVLVVRSALAWRRLEGRFVPGPGDSASGYTVFEDRREREGREARRKAAEVDLASLWEES
jgi:hypothetical protein